jgi:hypothetical protein
MSALADGAEIGAEDRSVKLFVLASRQATRLWAAALELCELTAGVPLSEAEACEYLLADFLSGLPPVDNNFQVYPLYPPRKHRCWAKRSVRRRKRRWNPSDELGSKRVELSALELSPQTRRVFEVLDEELSSDPFELDASLRALIAARRSLDLDLARLLRIFHWLGLARHIGFPNFSAYVEERLAVSAGRANFLARLDRALTGLDRTRKAIRRGRIGTVAALLISRVADERSERAWIERAARVTVTRLRKEVRWAERENAISGRRDTLPPSLGPLPSELQTLTVALLTDAPPQAHPFEGASAWVRQDTGPSDAGQGRGVNGSSRTGDASFARIGGSEDAGQESLARIDDSNGAGRETFARDDDALADLERAGVAQAVRIYSEMFADDQRPGDWIEVEFWLRGSTLPLWTEARNRLAAATGVKYVHDRQLLYDIAVAFLRTHIRPWLEAVVRGDPTAVRDRFTCQVPGCTMRVGAGHHLQYRSRLGPDEPWNLLFVCWVHHLLGIHGGGWLRVSGRAPEALTAELGLGPDGVPLELWVRGQGSPQVERACA